MGNHRGLGLHLIFVSFFLVANSCSCLGVENTSIVCFEQERLALLKFKHSVVVLGDESKMLSSWVGNDCCMWERVHCDSVTGNIKSLHLRDFTKLFDYFIVGDGVSFSLAELRHLNYLDLSGNDFGGSWISDFIGSFKQLSYLNLSHSGFQGIIPHHIGNLYNLKVLDLSSNDGLEADDMAWTFRLSSLEHLDLSDVYLGGAKNRGMALYMFPLLKELSLSRCGLSNADLAPFLNSSRIHSNIKYLDLSSNGLSGPIPKSLRRLIYLEVLDLSRNQLTGPIPTLLGNLTKIILSFNQLNGSIPEWFGRLTNLREIDLSRNQLTGPIPASLGGLVSVQTILLSSNMLNGTIPVSIGQLSKLQYLDMSNNSLEGVVFEAHFANLSMLQYLDTSSNTKLTFNVSREWIPSFQMVTLQLSSCNIVNGFPQWLRNQKNLETLALSNAKISGPLPTWLQKMPIIPFLDLSYNKLNGSLTNLPNGGNVNVNRYISRSLFLENNLFIGSIPKSLCRMTDLKYLDLSRNGLTGKIPKCLGNLQELDTMIFSSNQLSGVIPSSLALSSSLHRLKLNDNNFIGEPPSELWNLRYLEVLDLGGNIFCGNIPEWNGESLRSLMVLRLHKNNFTGRIPRSLCNSSDLHILDVAYNNLMGSIPDCLGELYAMLSGYTSQDYRHSADNLIQVMNGVDLEYTKTWDILYNMDLSSNKLSGEIPIELTALSGLMGLNLSNNHLSGGIPESIGDMAALISLDLSRNELIWMIPPSMSALTFLSHLNLSYNNLWGPIPTGNQLQTLDDPSIYAGNKDLCGPPLPKNCSNHEGPTTKREKKYKAADERAKEWLFYVDVMSGFATGFWGVIGVMLFKKQWRWKLFRFVEETMDKIYVAVVVRVAKMKRGREAA